jgi:hypothetical protein
MDPQLLRTNFSVAVFIILLGALILPAQDPSSAGFVVTIMAMGVGVVFIAAIALLARWAAPRVPKADDKEAWTGYNGSRPGGPASVLGPPAKERDDDD